MVGFKEEGGRWVVVRALGAGVVFPGLRRDSDCVSVVPWGPVVKDQGGRLLTRVGGDGRTDDRVVLCTFRHQITALDPVFSASVVRRVFFNIAFWLSTLYLTLVLLTILVQPIAANAPAKAGEVMRLSNLWLGSFQGIVASALGVLLFQNRRARRESLGRESEEPSRRNLRPSIRSRARSSRAGTAACGRDTY